MIGKYRHSFNIEMKTGEKSGELNLINGIRQFRATGIALLNQFLYFKNIIIPNLENGMLQLICECQPCKQLNAYLFF